MRHSFHFDFVLIAVLLAVCACAMPAKADSQSVSGCQGCNGYSFQATLTPTGTNSYSLSYTVTNVSGVAANPNTWSLTLFNTGNTVQNITNFSVFDASGNYYTSAYLVNAGKSNNGGNGNCNATLSDAVCVTRSGTGTLPALYAGQSLTFRFNFQCTGCIQLSAWDFLSSGTYLNQSGNAYAISAYGGTTSMPEPSALELLLASGLLFALYTLIRRRLKSRMYPPLMSRPVLRA